MKVGCVPVGYLRCLSSMTCLVLSRHVCRLQHCVSVFGPAHSLSGTDYKNSGPRRIKTSSGVAGPCPMQRLCGQRWKKSFHIQERQQRFCCCPSCRQKSEKQECVRAWSWLSSKQISVRCRQVCSACPHSCSCFITVFCFFQEPLLPCDVY